MNTRKEIQHLARIRLKEARVLYDNACYDGAVYLAGYSVELALKAAICKNLDVDSFFAPKPNEHFSAANNFKTHDLNVLLLYAGLHTKFDNEKALNATLSENWSLVTTWSEQKRYQSLTTKQNITPEQEAENFLIAIDHQHDGVLQWIQKHW